MKNKLLRLSLLSMLCILFGGNVFAEDTGDSWVKTDPSDLQTDDIVAIVDLTTAKAMANNGGTSNAPAATSVTLNADKTEITDNVAEELQWVVTVDTEANPVAYKFGKANTNYYLYCTNTNNGVRVGANANNSFIMKVADANNTNDYLYNTATSRYIGVYSNTDWRCYSTVNNNIKNTLVAFFKKTSSSTDNRTATTVTFADGYATSGAVGTQIDLPTATVKAGDNPINATVTWSSGNENVAEIVGTKINLKAAGTAVITASYAGDNSNKPSNASYTVTAYSTYTSLSALQEAATATSTPVQITFNNVYVTAVKNKNAYLADADGYGTLIYTDGHGLTAGKVLNGTTQANLELYNGFAELTDFSTTGLEITDGEYAPIVKTIDALTTANQCAVVTLKNVTYNATDVVFSDGTNSIKYYDNFGTSITLTDGAAYDVTGVVVLYKSNNETVLEICPRTADDVVAATTDDPAGFRDIKVNLTDASWADKVNSSGAASTIYITVAADGTIGTTENAEEAAATLTGYWHGTTYGWQQFRASVPVEGCVKITYGMNDYGGEVTVTDATGAEVATLDNKDATGKWSANNPDQRIAVAYYRTNQPTTLNFSQCPFVGYFAVEAIDEADLPPLVETATLTFDLGNQAAEGVVPDPITVVKGETVHFPANYTLYVEGKTLKGWTDADGNVLSDGVLDDDITVYPYFEDNTANLADRTEPVTISYNLSGYNDYPKYKFEGNSGIMVTQATVNGKAIDVKVDVNATSGKFSHNGSGWHQVNTGTKVTVPACKDAVIAVSTYNDTEGTSMTFAGNSGTSENKIVSYTATAGNATCEIAQVSNNYWNNLTVTLPVVEQGGDDPTETGVLYSWESPEGTPIETGGVAKSYNGDTETTNDPDNSDINAGNSDYHVLRLRGNASFTTNFITITLDNALKAGDKINITAYRNRNAADKKSGALIKFEKGSEQVRTDTSDKPGLEFVNIDTSDESAADKNRGTEPNTIQLTVPESAAGSTTLSLTRAQTGTNLFITKLVIESEGGDEPIEQDVTATWNFAGNCANLAPKSEGGTYTETTMASDVEGISMNIVYNNGQIKNNDNSYQVTTGVEMQIPVKNAGDVVTVVGYPDSNYSHYSVAGTEATEPTTEYTAKTADAAQGYVSVVSTNGNNYYLSISVLQKAPSVGPDLVEKSIYKTDFSEWEELTASQEESNVAKKTKFTNENLNFTFYNTGVNTGDYDETRFPNNNGYRIYCPKNAGGYVTTSALANITKVRFIHGATGSSRGYKLEAKGDGDEDWVVISDAYASPNGWCEVTKPINKTNCQLRFTNLAESQYAYIFELEIFGNVDLSGAPLLETMTANGKTYNADDIFEMATSGNYEATIELASSETMPSADNPVTATAANGEVGTITYATEEGNTIVTIPVTADNNTANYVATFTRKPMLTLTYIGVDGTTELGTQQVEKDAPIGEFAVDIENVSSLRNGYKARGWFKQNYVGEKYTTASTFSENANLYAVETEIEVPSTSRDYEFNLADQFFYAEDHEAFSPQEGAQCKWHDAQHGWSVYNGDKIDLLVGPKAIISVTTCKYGKLDNILVKKGDETLATLTGRDEDADGAVVSYNYEGEEGTLTLEMAASGEGYIHSVKIANIAETNYEKEGNWFMVKAGDISSLIDALEVANGASGEDRQIIFLPNGTYDLGTTVMTTISGSNISLIGESMEGVIIKNRPIKEGINESPTLVNTGSNNYFQDLTIECIAPWTGSAERGVALSDKGNNTICKNVYLKGLQDTYVSNNPSGTYYFEDGKIEGSVDYVCGYGDVYFNKVRFYTVNKSTGATGGCIAAPNTLKSFGYIFNECTLDGMANEDGKYRLARPWAENTIVRMLNTTMIIKPNAAGWGEWNPAHAVVQFAEYNSVDADGNAVDVSQRATTIGGQPNNPVITAEEAATYMPEAIFAGEWKPFDLTVQCEAPEAELKDGTITWTPADNGAIAYMVSKNGQMLAITTETSFVIDAVAGNAPRRADAADKYTIRAANPRGGFGEAKEVKETATGISTVKNGQQDDTIYNMQGVRVNHVQKGVYIVNGKKVVVK